MTDRTTLHFLTCGHVDDGKSTLIGRLLYDIGVIPDDQAKNAMVDGSIDYSRLTDGLEDERSQGITIDAAYRYFRYGGRHYRIADTPGHDQYVRNMAVAAANSDVALILIDGVHGPRAQTLRHARIAAFFGITQFVVAINKMDLVGYHAARFQSISDDVRKALADLSGLDLTFIPVSALLGVNVTQRSPELTPWYNGPSVMEYLAGVDVKHTHTHQARLPVQSVIRFGDKRGYQGLLTGGSIKTGDTLQVANAGTPVHVEALYHSGKPVNAVYAGQAITLVASEDVDVARGDVLCPPHAAMRSADTFAGRLLWLDPTLYKQDTVSALLKIHTHEEQAEVRLATPHSANDNPIVDATLFTALPIPFDSYATNRSTGLFMLIEPGSERVLGVGIAV